MKEHAKHNWPEDLGSELDQRRVDFIKADLKVCFTFAKVATTELKMGVRRAAAKAIGHAEKGYQTIRRFLTGPKHVSHITAVQIKDFKAKLRRLRQRLDGLQAP